MSSSFAKNAIVLGLLSAIGPFAIDMYLPALPAIAADLHASTAATQMTLMAFFLAFGVCQIVYGPVSDMVGRKPPLYFGIVIFALGSIGCGLAPSIAWLIFFRFVQGLGAAAVMVIPRAIIRDLHTGVDATRLMSLVMLVFSVSPILAPLIGSALIVPFGWRAVFVAVTLASVAVVSAGRLRACPKRGRRKSGSRSAFAACSVASVILLRDWRFLGLTFIGGFGMASFFAFLASSSFIYIGHFGLTPTQYSLAFSVNAIGFIGASQFSGVLAARFGIARSCSVAVAVYAALSLVLLARHRFGRGQPRRADRDAVLRHCLARPGDSSTMVLSLEDHGPIAGMASALGGTLQMVTGARDDRCRQRVLRRHAVADGATIAVCGVAAFILARLTFGPRKAVVATCGMTWASGEGLSRPCATPAHLPPRCGCPRQQTAW